ncbi:MAG: sulfatase [Candidatus Hydrogenedentes bacterium]|nr:sulfatase [Candidatus Hydrogenedentota bacterium]
MTIQAFSTLRSALMWCFLACLGMASIEVLTYYSTSDPLASMPFVEFAQRFSVVTAILLLVAILAWLLLHFFVVFLGGVRPGIALFFLLSFLMLFDFMVQSLDLVFTYTDKYREHRQLLLTDFAAISFIIAGVTSLVYAKVTRRRGPVALSPRVFTIVVFVLGVWAVATWARGRAFAEAGGGVFWGACAAAAVVGGVLIWRLGRSPRLLGAALAAVAAAVCAPLPWGLALPAERAPAAPALSAADHAIKRILLITVDTLRRDALGCYSARQDSTPRIDAFARDGAIFSNAFSTAPWTYPSVASILTGLPPRVHLLTDGTHALPDKVPTMAECFAAAGYRTAGLGFNGFLLPRSKLNRGFHEYTWFPRESAPVKHFGLGLPRWLTGSVSEKPASTELTEHAISWLKDHAREDFFFWVHYLEPHIPYAPPEAYLPAGPKLREQGDHFSDVTRGRVGCVARSAEERAWIRALYEGDVRYVDAEIGRLLDALRELGLYDDTLIVLTADHGEEFWDHDRFEHGHTLYNELVQVPLLVKLPGSRGAGTVDARVSTQAILPTVLDLCGVRPATARGLAPSFAEALGAAPPGYQETPVYSGATLFQDRAESVVFGPMKYVRGQISGHEMLFNLEQDPREMNSLVSEDAENLARGRQLLDEAVAAQERLREQMGVVVEDKDFLGEEAVQSLKALGYL